MSGTRLTTTPARGMRLLGVHGRPVIEGYRPLAQVLASRLGSRHAMLLARPERNSETGEIDWYAGLNGPVTALAALSPEAAERARALHRQLRDEAIALAAELAGGGEAGRLIGESLTQALAADAPDRIYLVGDQPVLAPWGVVADPTAVVERMPRQVAVDGVLEPAKAAALAAPAGERRGWWWWLLPALLALVLGWLTLRACAPLPPVVVEAPAPPAGPDAARRLADEEAREAALRAALADAEAARATELGRCVADTPPPARVADLPPAPPPPEPARIEPPRVEPPRVEPPRVEPPRVEQPRSPPAVARPPATPAPRPAPAIAPTPRPAPANCPPPRAPYDAPEVVLVVDGSGSMNEPYLGAASRMDLAKRSIATIVANLPPDVNVGLVDFQSCAQVRRQKFYSPAERPELLGEINGLRPFQGTPLARSIERAGNIASGDVETTVVIVSDGDDTCGGDPCAAARAAKAAKPKLTINIVDLSGERGRAVVQCVAQATGGRVLAPNTPAEVTRAMREASRQPDMRDCPPGR